MKTLKSLLVWSALITTLMTLLGLFFVASNGDYELRDANNALLDWKEVVTGESHFRGYEMPIGIGSVAVDQLAGEAYQASAYGASRAGNALAIYITPDFVPFTCGLAWLWTAFLVVAYVVCLFWRTFGIDCLAKIKYWQIERIRKASEQ
ncbi:MAG: hypothetical protein V4467_00255 [Patescibacteria group bacterium]